MRPVRPPALSIPWGGGREGGDIQQRHPLPPFHRDAWLGESRGYPTGRHPRRGRALLDFSPCPGDTVSLHLRAGHLPWGAKCPLQPASQDLRTQDSQWVPPGGDSSGCLGHVLSLGTRPQPRPWAPHWPGCMGTAIGPYGHPGQGLRQPSPVPMPLPPRSQGEWGFDAPRSPPAGVTGFCPVSFLNSTLPIPVTESCGTHVSVLRHCPLSAL